MDLSTIERNLRQGIYTNVFMFATDMRKMFSNSIRYYGVSNQ